MWKMVLCEIIHTLYVKYIWSCNSRHVICIRKWFPVCKCVSSLLKVDQPASFFLLFCLSKGSLIVKSSSLSLFRSTRRARCLNTKLESKLGKVWLELVKRAPRQIRPRTQAHYWYGDMDLIDHSSHVSIIQTSLLVRISKWEVANYVWSRSSYRLY